MTMYPIENEDINIPSNYRCPACDFIGLIAIAYSHGPVSYCPICGGRLQPYIYDEYCEEVSGPGSLPREDDGEDVWEDEEDAYEA